MKYKYELYLYANYESSKINSYRLMMLRLSSFISRKLSTKLFRQFRKSMMLMAFDSISTQRYR